MKQPKAWGLVLSGLAAGAVNGLLGAGGGMILVPLLGFLTRLEDREIFSASLAIILPISLISLLVSAANGTLILGGALPWLIGSAAGGIIAGLTAKKNSHGVASPWAWYSDSVGRDPILMPDSILITLAVATALGFLSGLGIGGGSLLILWLTLVQGVDPATARSINLLFFLPSALISCLFRSKQGILTIGDLIPAIVAGCLSAGLCAWLSPALEPERLIKLFAILLIAAGVRELVYRPKKAR